MISAEEQECPFRQSLVARRQRTVANIACGSTGYRIRRNLRIV